MFRMFFNRTMKLCFQIYSCFVNMAIYRWIPYFIDYRIRSSLEWNTSILKFELFFNRRVKPCFMFLPLLYMYIWYLRLIVYLFLNCYYVFTHIIELLQLNVKIFIIKVVIIPNKNNVDLNFLLNREITP